MGFVFDAFTGKKQAKAATQAAQTQSDASKYAADLAQKQYEQSRKDQMPWVDAGKGALTGLQQMLANNSPATAPQQRTATSAPPQTVSAPQPLAPQQSAGVQYGNSELAGKVNSLFGNKGGFINKALGGLLNGVAAGQAQQQQPSAPPQESVGNSAAPGAEGSGFVSDGSGVYQDKWGNRLDEAYENGKLTGGLDPNNFETDPSYQFRKKEGMDGIQSSAAASGGLLSGAALKALTGYNSDLASQEYGNAWQRDQAQKEREWGVLNGGRTQDYNIFQSENTRKFNQMASVAGTGQTTATNLGSLGAANAQTVGDGAINSANAQANGIVGAANAKANGFRNLIGVGSGLLGLI